jgi:hypothetical protein
MAWRRWRGCLSIHVVGVTWVMTVPEAVARNSADVDYRAMLWSEPPLPENRERRCPACHSEQITALGHVTASAGVIKSEQRCKACGTAFWFVRNALV